MKKDLILRVLLALFFSPTTCSSFAQVSVFVDAPLVAAKGETVTVQLRVSDFEQVGSIQFSVNWSPDALEYINDTVYLPGMVLNSEHAVSTGITRASWFSANGITLPDDAVMVQFVFKVKVCDDAGIQISITDSPTFRELGILVNGVPKEGVLTTTNGAVLASCSVQNKHQVYIPNVFSPTSGAENAVFKLGVSMDVLRVKSIMIFDRWGELVCRPTEASEGWDGTQRGQVVAPGVYVYAIEVLFDDGVLERYHGDILVIR